MKKHLLLAISFLAIQILATPVTGWCENSKISVKAEVDRAFFTIGDRVRFKITAEHDSSIQIVRMDTSETFKDFELKEEKELTTNQGSTITEGKEIIFTAYDLGDYVLSPVIIYYHETGSGQELKQIESNKLYITVESIEKDGKKSDDIAGIKGVVELSRKWVGWIIAGILILIAAGAFYFYDTRRKEALLNQGHKSSLTPHEEAYQELNRLYDSDLLQRGQLKLYFARISEIIRRYIERRYNILALESTTAEIMQEMRHLDLDGKTLSLIKGHLEVCDLAKFAKYRPEPAEIIRQTKLAREIIDITKPSELPKTETDESTANKLNVPQ